MPLRRLLTVVRLRLRTILRRNRVEDDLAAEIQFHLEQRACEFVAGGMNPEAARDAARRAFGGVEQRKEECRDQRRVGWLEDLARDTRYAARMMRRSPGFTAVAVISLALGLGANTAVFTAIDFIMLRTLPVPRPNELVGLRWTAASYPEAFVESIRGGRYANEIGTDVFSYRTFRELNDANEAFASVFAFTGNIDRVNVGLDHGADSADVLGVSGNYFDALGVAALIGRTLVPSDDSHDAPLVAVTSHAFWQSKLGGNPGVIGRAILVNGDPVTIVGVAPPFFFGLEPGATPDFWVPLNVYARHPANRNVSRVTPSSGGVSLPLVDDDKTWWLRIGARLKPGAAPAAALAATTVIFERSIGRPEQPAAPVVPRLGTMSLAHGVETLQQSFSRSLLLLMAIVGLVLLIACANLASLLLERARAREREIAVRLSLGVSRARLLRQLLTESVALAMLGGIAAFLVASWTYPMLMRLLVSERLAPHLAFAIDVRVFAFGVLASFAAGMTFGLAPAWRASSLNLAGALKQRSQSEGGHRNAFAAGRLLLALQVAVCLVLLIAAGLFVRTLQRLYGAELGFDRNHLVLFSVSPASNGYAQSRLSAYYTAVQQHVRSLPGVVSVTLAHRPPIGGGAGRSTGRIIGYTPPDESVEFYRHEIGTAYFATLGISLVAGRAIDQRDTAASARVLVVNQTVVRKFFGTDNPVGHYIDFGSPAQPLTFEIIGVVGDVKYSRIQADVPPTVYMPHEQAFGPSNAVTFIVRTTADSSTIVPLIRRELQQIDGRVPMTGVRSQAQAIDQTLATERTFAILSSVFGVIALLVACVGLYGTAAYAVTRRTNEIGIRIALGASRKVVLASFLRESLQTVGVGATVGLLTAFVGGRAIAARLYGISPSDGPTLAAATAILVAVTTAAALIPAHLATEIDPAIALRND